MNSHSTPTIALQLYTLRDFLKTPAQIAETLKKVRTIGYSTVELAGLGPIEPKELAAILSGEGLACCSAHVPIEKLRTGLSQVIADHLLFKCQWLAVPGCWGKTLADFESFADDMNHFAAPCREGGMPLGYHNHSHEFVRYDGRSPISVLLDELSTTIWFEIDTYWIAHAGADPIDWIRKVSSRIPCVHLKDMAIGSDGKQYMAEIGEGNLNWPGILSACAAAGTRYLIVEQDICRRDPFESVAISLQNLREMLG
jgi:sugar phosphate isomerase/epimerase